MTIGEKITIYRNNRGFSQDELAYKVGANAELLRAWEEDREIPNAVHLLALKSALGVGIDDLLSDNKRPVKRMSGKQKALSLTLFILSCASFFIALILALILLPLSNGNFAKNLWLCFLFTPVAIGSIIFGFICKKKGISAKKNLIAGFVVLPLLLIYGCLCFIPSSSGNPADANEFLQTVTTQTGVTIPEGENINYYEYKTGYTTFKSTVYAECTVTFNRENTTKLYNEITSSSKWEKILPTRLVSYLPNVSHFSNEGNYYYLIYNTYSKKYNEIPSEEGRVPFIAMLYDCNNNVLYVWDYVVDCVK